MQKGRNIVKVQCLSSSVKAVWEIYSPHLTRIAGLGALSALLVLAMPLLALAADINWGNLNLSPQQENQINQLEGSWEKTHQDISGQIDRDMAELRQILPTGDTQRIRQLQNRITQNKMYLMNQSMDTFLKKRDTLTPGQRQQLQKMMPAKN